mgnify:CR=1 FL=1
MDVQVSFNKNTINLKLTNIYVKENDVWEKEDENNSHLRKAIKNISYNNHKLLPELNTGVCLSLLPSPSAKHS